MEEVFTAQQTAAFLKVGIKRLRRLVKENHVPAVRLGRELRFSRVALERWLLEGGTSGSGEPK